MATAVTENGPFTLYESDIAVVSSAITLTGLDVTKLIGFAGVKFFSDASGTPATPTSGTAEFDLRTIVAEPEWEGILGGLLQLTDAPSSVSWEAPTKDVRVTPNTIAGGGVTHWRLVVSLNNAGGVSR